MNRVLKAFATAAGCGCVLAGGAQVAVAQTTGHLTGIARDATGAVVPGVTVTLTGGTLATPVAMETDHQGRFAITLPPGLYQLTAAAAGFESSETKVELRASGATLDIWLQMDASFSDSLTVTATRTGTADIQTTPIAITALPARRLEERAVERVEHLAGLVPTLGVSETP